ncbi:MAG: hypothetical protein ACOX0I_04105 [Bacilli bacterium]
MEAAEQCLFSSVLVTSGQFRDGNALYGVTGNYDHHPALLAEQVTEQSFPHGDTLASDDAVFGGLFGNADL